jgi:hypothetical protein
MTTMAVMPTETAMAAISGLLSDASPSLGVGKVGKEGITVETGVWAGDMTGEGTGREGLRYLLQ